MTGKIEKARQEVEAIKAEIEQMKDELHRQMIERGQLGSGKITDVDSRTRYDALSKTIQTLQAEIPSKQRYDAGEPRPAIQHRLESAQRDYELLRRERFNTAQSITRLEELKKSWADNLPKVADLSRELLAIFNRAGTFPPGVNERHLAGWAIWAKNNQAEIDYLPTLERRLAEYGDDPDYRPNEPNQVDRAFWAANYGTPDKADDLSFEALEQLAAETNRLYQQS